MAFNVSYIYDIKDRYSRVLQGITRHTKRYEEQARKAQLQAKRLGSTFDRTGQNMRTNGAQMSAMALGVGYLAKKLVDGSLSIEDSLADVSRVSNIAGADLVKFRKDLELMSERLGKPAEGLARIAFEGGRLGIAKKNLLDFTNEVVKMAIAFDMTEEQAGASIGSIKAKLGLTMTDVSNLADRMNYLADNTAAAGDRMITIIARVSGSMKIIKAPTAAMVGLAAFADQLEVTPQLAASGINMMMSRMMKMPGMMDKLLNDPIKAIRGTLQELANMPEAQRAAVIFKRFGEESGRFVLKATGSLALFDDAIAKSLSSGAIGSMDREMANRARRSSTAFKKEFQGMRNEIARFGDTIKPMAISLFQFVRNTLRILGEFSAAHPMLIKMALGFTAIIAVVAPLITFFGVMIMSIGAITTAIGVMMPFIAPVVAGLAAMIAMLGGPLVVAGVVAFQTILILGEKFGWLEKIGSGLKNMFTGLIGKIKSFWDIIRSGAGLEMIKNKFKGLFGMDSDLPASQNSLGGGISANKNSPTMKGSIDPLDVNVNVTSSPELSAEANAPQNLGTNAVFAM